jgi:hypothetical protein
MTLYTCSKHNYTSVDSPCPDCAESDMTGLLIAVLDQCCGYMRDDNILQTNYNSEACAVHALINAGYANYVFHSKKWPYSKILQFKWTAIFF